MESGKALGRGEGGDKKKCDTALGLKALTVYLQKQSL